MWLNADSAGRAAITRSANATDRTLAMDAHTKGSFIVPRLREITIDSLLLRFHVSEDDRLVLVLTLDFQP
jgi:hypothetical protein